MVRGQSTTLAALPKGKPVAPREVQPQQLIRSGGWARGFLSHLSTLVSGEVSWRAVMSHSTGLGNPVQWDILEQR